MLPEVSGETSMESVHVIPSNNLFAVVLTLQLPSTTDFHLTNSCSWQGASELNILVPKVDILTDYWFQSQKLSIDLRCVYVRIDMLSILLVILYE